MKTKTDDPLKIDPEVQKALDETAKVLGETENLPDFYCPKHGNIGLSTMILATDGEIISNHCVRCISELLKATVGEVVPPEDLLRAQTLVASCLGLDKPKKE